MMSSSSLLCGACLATAVEDHASLPASLPPSPAASLARPLTAKPPRPPPLLPPSSQLGDPLPYHTLPQKPSLLLRVGIQSCLVFCTESIRCCSSKFSPRIYLLAYLDFVAGALNPRTDSGLLQRRGKRAERHMLLEGPDCHVYQLQCMWLEDQKAFAWVICTEATDSCVGFKRCCWEIIRDNHLCSV